MKKKPSILRGSYAEADVNTETLQPGQLQALLKEAADTANFLMMICDKAGCYDQKASTEKME